MTPEALRTLAHVHGALAWASVVALGAALWAAASRRPRAGWLPAVSFAAVLAAFTTGALLHAPFQSRLRQRLFLASSALGWLFERKEHAAFGALALSGCALCALWAETAAARGGEAEAARALRRAAVIALAAALALGALSIAASVAAARRVHF